MICVMPTQMHYRPGVMSHADAQLYMPTKHVTHQSKQQKLPRCKKMRQICMHNNVLIIPSIGWLTGG